MPHKYMPINVSVLNRPCLVVGGGTVALRKVEALLDYDTAITVIAPEAHEKLAYHAEKGYTNEPKRCTSCRLARRNRGSNGGFNNAYDQGRREMHPTVCAECGKDTMVPFQPSGDRPVYCSDCYNRRGGGVRTSRY